MRRPYGKVSIVSLLIMVALAYGLWWLITIGPAYFDNLDVKEAVQAAMNQAKNRKTDGQITASLIAATSKVGEHLADDGYGNITWKTGLGLTSENIAIIRDEAHDEITIRVEYTRVRMLKPFSGEREINFVVEETWNSSK